MAVRYSNSPMGVLGAARTEKAEAERRRAVVKNFMVIKLGMMV